MSIKGLHIGASGLRAAQLGLQTVSHNLANVNTDGYSRQRVDQSSLEPSLGGFHTMAAQSGNGVGNLAVNRVRDAFLDRSVRDATADHGAADVRSDFLDRAQQLTGPIDAGINADLSAFWQAWDTLSLAPADRSSRQTVVSAGEALASSIRRAAGELERLSGDARNELEEGASEVNRLTAEIARLNGVVRDTSASGVTPNDALDKLDVAADRLAELVGGTVRRQSDNTIDVFVGSMPLVRSERAETVEVAGTPPRVSLVDGGFALAPRGRLGGLESLLGAELPAIAGEIDGVAATLREVVNGLHRDDTAGGRGTFDLNGDPGGDFFAGTSAADLTIAATLTADTLAASLTANPNDGNNAIALSGARTATGAGGVSVGDSLRRLTSNLGTRAADARTGLDSADLSRSELERQRQSQTAVSVDEELTDLIRYQRAYEAAARVITAADEMLDRLINGTGRVGR